MEYENLTPVIGTIVNITDSDCCSKMLTIRTEEGVVNFVVDSQTLVIDCMQLRQGMRAAAFYDSSEPALMIFPPQYRACLVTVLDRNEQVVLKYFNRALLAEDNSLQLNVASNTRMQTVNGQKFSCCIGGRTLLVFYTATTRSIPPQTTPEKVVVMCG